MTDQPAKPDLGMEDGRPVTRVELILRRTGDGLSETMKTDPTVMAHGERFVFAGDGEIDKVRFDRVLSKGEDTGQLARVHIANAETITILDPDIATGVAELIAKQKERNAIRREEEAGSVALDRALAELQAELRGDHVLGLHREPSDEPGQGENVGPQEACELCQQEGLVQTPTSNEGE